MSYIPSAFGGRFIRKISPGAITQDAQQDSEDESDDASSSVDGSRSQDSLSLTDSHTTTSVASLVDDLVAKYEKVGKTHQIKQMTKPGQPDVDAESTSPSPRKKKNSIGSAKSWKSSSNGSLKPSSNGSLKPSSIGSFKTNSIESLSSGSRGKSPKNGKQRSAGGNKKSPGYKNKGFQKGKGATKLKSKNSWIKDPQRQMSLSVESDDENDVFEDDDDESFDLGKNNQSAKPYIPIPKAASVVVASYPPKNLAAVPDAKASTVSKELVSAKPVEEPLWAKKRKEILERKSSKTKSSKPKPPKAPDEEHHQSWEERKHEIVKTPETSRKNSFKGLSPWKSPLTQSDSIKPSPSPPQKTQSLPPAVLPWEKSEPAKPAVLPWEKSKSLNPAVLPWEKVKPSSSPAVPPPQKPEPPSPATLPWMKTHPSRTSSDDSLPSSPVVQNRKVPSTGPQLDDSSSAVSDDTSNAEPSTPFKVPEAKSTEDLKSESKPKASTPIVNESSNDEKVPPPPPPPPPEKRVVEDESSSEDDSTVTSRDDVEESQTLMPTTEQSHASGDNDDSSSKPLSPKSSATTESIAPAAPETSSTSNHDNEEAGVAQQDQKMQEKEAPKDNLIDNADKEKKPASSDDGSESSGSSFDSSTQGESSSSSGSSSSNSSVAESAILNATNAKDDVDSSKQSGTASIGEETTGLPAKPTSPGPEKTEKEEGTSSQSPKGSVEDSETTRSEDEGGAVENAESNAIVPKRSKTKSNDKEDGSSSSSSSSSSGSSSSSSSGSSSSGSSSSGSSSSGSSDSSVDKDQPLAALGSPVAANRSPVPDQPLAANISLIPGQVLAANRSLIPEPAADNPEALAQAWEKMKEQNEGPTEMQSKITMQELKRIRNQEKESHVPRDVDTDDESKFAPSTADVALDVSRVDTKLQKELARQGIAEEILCDHPDDASELSVSGTSYVKDLKTQQKNREKDLKEETLEDALELYRIAIEQGEEKDEKLFLQIVSELQVENEAKAKIHWRKQDERLDREIRRRSGETVSDSEHDSVAEEEEEEEVDGDVVSIPPKRRGQPVLSGTESDTDDDTGDDTDDDTDDDTEDEIEFDDEIKSGDGEAEETDDEEHEDTDTDTGESSRDSGDASDTDTDTDDMEKGISSKVLRRQDIETDSEREAGVHAAWLSKKEADLAERESRLARRVIIATSILCFVAFGILLFFVLDPLHRNENWALFKKTDDTDNIIDPGGRARRLFLRGSD